MTPLLHDLAAGLQKQNPNLLVEEQSGGSGIGWDELRTGRADMAALSYWDETAAPPEGFQLIPVARDGIAVIVHPRNPISNVTALQLRALSAARCSTGLRWAASRASLRSSAARTAQGRGPLSRRA